VARALILSFSLFLTRSALGEPTPAESAAARRGIALSDRLIIEGDALDRLPSNGSIANVLSRSILPAIYAHEESMGFSDIEPERFSLAGNSAMWSEWRVDGLNLSDPFFEGAAAFKVPFVFLTGVELLQQESPRHPFQGGVRLLVDPAPSAPTRLARASFGLQGVGNTIPFAEKISDFITTAHTRSRQTQPEEDRRRLMGRLQASLLDTERVGALTVRWAAEIDGNLRHQVQFPTAERNQPGLPYDERTLRTSAIAELAPDSRAWKLLGLAEYRRRDDLYTERKFSHGETVTQSSGGVLVGFVSDSLRAGLTFKHDRLIPNVRDFSRELLDVDGEGFFPFIPTGAMNSVRVDLGYSKNGFYVGSDTRVLAWTPDGNSVHPVTFEGQPFGSVTVESRPTVTLVGSHRVGYSNTWQAGRFELAFDSYALMNHATPEGAPGLVFPDVGAELQTVWHLTPYFEPFLTVAKSPLSIPTQNALALTPGYSTVTSRTEAGQVYQRLGGDSAALGENLRGPNLYTAAFGFTSRFAGQWKVTLQGLAKAWHSLSRFVPDGAPDQYGHFTDGFYFADRAVPRYLLVNDPFAETPYGGQLQLEVARLQDEKGFLSFGFSAANFFGHPPFGNGAYGNDIGLVDQLGANPNARYRSLSNTDADRAFVLKFVGGKRLWRGLWASFAIFYKDGQPFGYWDTAVENGQLALKHNSNRGSAMQISSPLIGWREDYQVEVDVRLAYDVSLGGGWTLRTSLLCTNLLDLGNEASERHWAPYDRSALELQLPRGLNLTVELVR